MDSESDTRSLAGREALVACVGRGLALFRCIVPPRGESAMLTDLRKSTASRFSVRGVDALVSCLCWRKNPATHKLNEFCLHHSNQTHKHAHTGFRNALRLSTAWMSQTADVSDRWIFSWSSSCFWPCSAVCWCRVLGNCSGAQFGPTPNFARVTSLVRRAVTLQFITTQN